MSDHAYLIRRSTNDIILRDPTSKKMYSFTVPQLREYCKLDRRLWNSDTECAYSFSLYDPETEETTLATRPAVDIDELAPLPDAPSAAPEFTPEERRIVHGSLILTAGRHIHGLEMASKRRAEKAQLRVVNKRGRSVIGTRQSRNPSPIDDMPSSSRRRDRRAAKKARRAARDNSATEPVEADAGLFSEDAEGERDPDAEGEDEEMVESGALNAEAEGK